MRLEDDEYGAVAPVYDAATAWALDPLRRELADVLMRERAGRVLDLCCGTREAVSVLCQSRARRRGAGPIGWHDPENR